jgi:hypothetical protein
MIVLNLETHLDCRGEPMDPDLPPPVKTFLLTAFFLAIPGWGGLIVLLLFTLPTVGPRWLFFFLTVIALTGTILPAAAFLNRRFPTKPPASSLATLREAIWIGIYFPTLAWLQMGRVLSPELALLLALGFALIEFLLRWRERSIWRP